MQDYKINDKVIFSNVIVQNGKAVFIKEVGTVISERVSKYNGNKRFLSVKTPTGVYTLWDKNNVQKYTEEVANCPDCMKAA